MAATHVKVDIPALKARHPLGDAVEAAGVRLRGRGRVRQGICPFHEEAEGSFTVYSDSQRFYCFGCGAGGDVLDFIQRTDNLSLPEALRRLDGNLTLVPKSLGHPAKVSNPRPAALPQRDPTLLTAATRFYVHTLEGSSEARTYLASRGIGPVAATQLGLGFANGRGLRAHLETLGFTEKRVQDSGLFTTHGAERFAGMIVIPDLSRGLVRWLAGRALQPGAKPRFQSLPGPKSVLGLGRLPAAQTWAVVAEGLFDWLCLAQWGLPAVAALGTHGLERVASAPSGLPQGVPCLRQRRHGHGSGRKACGPTWTQGRCRQPAQGLGRRGRACHPSPRARYLP